MLKVLATPADFLRFQKRLFPWIAGIFSCLLVTGLWYGLVNSPPDYQQGESVRIMYVHVPASWMALGVYTLMACCAVVGFVSKHLLAELVLKAAAPIGACFTLISLLTGALWGKPMWGAWWVWDARLTSVLILLFLYLGYMMLVESHDDPSRGLKFGSILVMIGALNLPVIKWSVTWWTTLHQPASFLRVGGSAVHESMILPLFLMTGAYAAFFLLVLLWRLETEILKRKIITHQHKMRQDVQERKQVETTLRS
jgi:heme exporter protein C